VTYKLYLDPVVHEAYARLSEQARRDLASCLLDAAADPLAHSEPYGIDDGRTRTIARGHVAGVILIGVDTITLVQLTAL
jgi:hypothetical protein